MTDSPHKPLAHSVSDAGRRAGIGRNKTFEELQSGRLRSFRVGRRRLVSEQAILDWIAEREAEECSNAAKGAV